MGFSYFAECHVNHSTSQKPVIKVSVVYLYFFFLLPPPILTEKADTESSEQTYLAFGEQILCGFYLHRIWPERFGHCVHCPWKPLHGITLDFRSTAQV